MSRMVVHLALAAGLALMTLACGGDETETPVPDAAPEMQSEATAPEEEVVAEVDPAQAAARAEAEQADTAEALAILKVMSDFLAGQPALRFEAEVGWDAMQVTGQRLEFGARRVMTVRRPDRARMESVRRDGEVATVYFDGQRISIDLPDEQAYVSLERPGTLDQAIDYLTDEMNTPVRLGDLVQADIYGDVAPKVVSGFWVGEEEIEGVLCDHIALRAEHVDAQLWVEEGDRPVPLRMVITYREAAGTPQFWAQTSGWDFAPDVPDSLFEYTPPEGAEQIPMLAALETRKDEVER